MNKLLRKILCAGLATAVMMATAVTASAASAADFADVKPTAWYYNAVDYAAAESLFSGTGDGEFSPDMGMTRGMFVTVLGRKSGVSDTKPASSRFSDVKIKDYFSPYTEWAAKYGIVNGTGNGKFSPNDRITREQMAKILYGYAQKTGNDTSVDPSKFEAFPDKGKVSGYAVQAMKWAVSHGIINGSDGRLDPKGTATRAQVAQVFLNAREVLTKTEIVEQPLPGPDSGSDSPEMAHLKQLLADRLPPTCKWNEDLLTNGGWYGPMSIEGEGSLESIAEGCVYLLTELDGTVYDYYCLREDPPGIFYCYYG